MIVGAIFDYGRTLHEYETDQLYPGAEEALRFLKDQEIKMAVVSRAQDPEKRRQDFDRFNLKRFFAVFEIVPSEGAKTFGHILEELKVKPGQCLVIGDRIKSEIVEANKIGAITIWVRQGKFKDETPDQPIEEPTYEVSSMKELLSLLNKLINP